MRGKPKNFQEKRQESRAEVLITTKFRKIDAEIYKKGKIRDISDSGICLYAKADLKEGDRIEFLVDDPRHGYYLGIAEVKWVRKWMSRWNATMIQGAYVHGLEIKEKSPL